MFPEHQHTHVEWRAGMTFDATTTTGHHIVLDAPPPNGDDRGPKPIELLLTALAGCTAMDVLSILQKKREPVLELVVDVEGTRAATHPMIYTDIEIIYRVRGDVTPDALERAIELSCTKYCGVHAMLEHRAHLHTRYEIQPSEFFERKAVFGPESIVEHEHITAALP
jgi:putative redox protein